MGSTERVGSRIATNRTVGRVIVYQVAFNIATRTVHVYVRVDLEDVFFFPAPSVLCVSGVGGGGLYIIRILVSGVAVTSMSTKNFRVITEKTVFRKSYA